MLLVSTHTFYTHVNRRLHSTYSQNVSSMSCAAFITTIQTKTLFITSLSNKVQWNIVYKNTKACNVINIYHRKQHKLNVNKSTMNYLPKVSCLNNSFWWNANVIPISCYSNMLLRASIKQHNCYPVSWKRTCPYLTKNLHTK